MPNYMDPNSFGGSRTWVSFIRSLHYPTTPKHHPSTQFQSAGYRLRTLQSWKGFLETGDAWLRVLRSKDHGIWEILEFQKAVKLQYTSCQ